MWKNRGRTEEDRREDRRHFDCKEEAYPREQRRGHGWQRVRGRGGGRGSLVTVVSKTSSVLAVRPCGKTSPKLLSIDSWVSAPMRSWQLRGQLDEKPPADLVPTDPADQLLPSSSVLSPAPASLETEHWQVLVLFRNEDSKNLDISDSVHHQLSDNPSTWTSVLFTQENLYDFFSNQNVNHCVLEIYAGVFWIAAAVSSGGTGEGAL